MKTFASIEEFYRDNETRRHVMEHDLGVWWKDDGGSNWRVTWVDGTGEVYALRLGPTRVQRTPLFIGGETIMIQGSGDPSLEGPLVVLGVIPPSEGECIRAFCSGNFHGMDCPADPAFKVEQVLDGWAEICGEPGSLNWVREKVTSLNQLDNDREQR
jgi:hypothetical protein